MSTAAKRKSIKKHPAYETQEEAMARLFKDKEFEVGVKKELAKLNRKKKTRALHS